MGNILNLIKSKLKGSTTMPGAPMKGQHVHGAGCGHDHQGHDHHHHDEKEEDSTTPGKGGCG